MNKHKNSVSLVCRACGKKAKDGEHLRSVTVPNYRTAKLLSFLNQDENKPDHEKVCRGCLRKMQSFGSKSRSEDQQKWFDDFGFYRFPAICSGLVCEICNQFLMSQLCPLALLWLLSLLSFLKLPPLSSLPPLTLHRHQEAYTERKLPSLLSGGLMKYLN